MVVIRCQEQQPVILQHRQHQKLNNMTELEKKYNIELINKEMWVWDYEDRPFD